MKSVRVIDGDVVCPKCGARNQFVSKRTGKAKWMAIPTVGIGVLAAPKRLKCNGCGTNLKRASPYTATRPATPRTRTRAERDGITEWSAVCPNGHTAYYKATKGKIVCSECGLVKGGKGWP